MLRRIIHELKHHAPFTVVGTVVGVGLLAGVVHWHLPQEMSQHLFEAFHPLHVLFSAIVTASLYRIYTKGAWWKMLLVGYIGSVGIGTLSDCLIPYLGELIMGMHDAHVHAEAHIGFIEHWWLVNPMAILGSLVPMAKPITRLPHAFHVLLSTAASLFHMTWSISGHDIAMATLVMTPVFLFLAVWLPCCTSDIVFPLLFVRPEDRPACSFCEKHAHTHSESKDA